MVCRLVIHLLADLVTMEPISPTRFCHYTHLKTTKFIVHLVQFLRRRIMAMLARTKCMSPLRLPAAPLRLSKQQATHTPHNTCSIYLLYRNLTISTNYLSITSYTQYGILLYHFFYFIIFYIYVSRYYYYIVIIFINKKLYYNK